MSDVIDQACDYVEQMLQRQLAARPRFDAPSLKECMACGEPISPERQKLGGVVRCIDCQSAFERSKR